MRTLTIKIDDEEQWFKVQKELMKHFEWFEYETNHIVTKIQEGFHESDIIYKYYAYHSICIGLIDDKKESLFKDKIHYFKNFKIGCDDVICKDVEELMLIYENLEAYKMRLI